MRHSVLLTLWVGCPGSWLCSEEGVGVLGSPGEGVGEAGGSSESEFSSEKSSTRALRPRMESGRGARLQRVMQLNSLTFQPPMTRGRSPVSQHTTHNAMLSMGMNTTIFETVKW